MQSGNEVANVIRSHWKLIEQSVTNKILNTWQLRTLSALMKCRTSALGGHVDGCTHCGKARISYNSCRNRHCPKCQGNEREAWIQAREKELLPVAYFHVVFTLPSELNRLCMQYPRLLYASLFDAAWDTINTFAKDEKHLGATTGMISILHTWGQQLTLHPHLHCIVPAGGLTKQGQWKHSKTKGDYLFPVKALSVVYRAKYIHHLRKHVAAHNEQATHRIILPKEVVDACFAKPWVVYAKKPFCGVKSVVEYLGRYTHKVAINNNRITAIDKINSAITFNYKDYQANGIKKSLTLNAIEFVRRFSLHILPKSFVRIRHYGILSSTSKAKAIAAIRKQLPSKLILVTRLPIEKYNPLQCPCCKNKTMIRIIQFDQRGPPTQWREYAKQRLTKLMAS